MKSSREHGGGWLTGPEIVARVGTGEITIDPFNADQVNPNSYNYTLWHTVRRIKNETFDLRGRDECEDVALSDAGTLLLPGECYLGCTNERMGSSKFAALVTGRSSVGRKFVTNHVTAGLIDTGFVGRITLEITVARPTIFYPGIIFGQIFWFTAFGEVAQYTGKYQEQAEPTLSRIYIDALKSDEL
jgi:dCTP deaminase